jgi:hypothetical protein
MRPNPSDPKRTVSVAIVATRLRSERLGELRPEPGPHCLDLDRIGDDQVVRGPHSPVEILEPDPTDPRLGDVGAEPGAWADARR